MKKKYLLTFILALGFGVILAQNKYAFNSIDSLQEPVKITTWDLAKYDASLAWGGFKNVFASPFKWDQDDWATAAAIGIGTAGLHILDDDASRYFKRQEKDIPSIIRDFGWYFGSPQNNYGVNGGIYLVGLFTKNEKIRRTGILMITSASAAGLVQTVAKKVTGRARPSDGGKFTFKPFKPGGGYHSFPSGHTILSFTTFYSLSKQFDNPWIKGGLITAGMISPVSRLWAGAHWLTDVALSVALTVVVVDSVDNYLDKQMKSDADLERAKRNSISWRLQMGPGAIGLRGTF